MGGGDYVPSSERPLNSTGKREGRPRASPPRRKAPGRPVRSLLHVRRCLRPRWGLLSCAGAPGFACSRVDWPRDPPVVPVVPVAPGRSELGLNATEAALGACLPTELKPRLVMDRAAERASGRAGERLRAERLRTQD